MTDDEIIAVVQAHKEGYEIQGRTKIQSPLVDADWWDYKRHQVILWDFRSNEYRVKPEPRKPREWWVYVNGDVLYGKMSFPDQDSTCIRVREVIE